MHDHAFLTYKGKRPWPNLPLLFDIEEEPYNLYFNLYYYICMLPFVLPICLTLDAFVVY